MWFCDTVSPSDKERFLIRCQRECRYPATIKKAAKQLRVLWNALQNPGKLRTIWSEHPTSLLSLCPHRTELQYLDGWTLSCLTSRSSSPASLPICGHNFLLHGASQGQLPCCLNLKPDHLSLPSVQQRESLCVFLQESFT